MDPMIESGLFYVIFEMYIVLLIGENIENIRLTTRPTTIDYLSIWNIYRKEILFLTKPTE